MSYLARIARAIPETYALNIPQLFHMVILAGFVPWYIGVENYGLFAALIALPGLAQSFFESFCVSIQLKYGRRDVLHRPIKFVVLPAVGLFFIAFVFLLEPMHAVFASVMTAGLFWRSFFFATAVSVGGLTREIAISEALILICYLSVAAAALAFGVRDLTLPMLMVAVASAVSAWYLRRALQFRHFTSCNESIGAKPNIPVSVVVRALSARAYEDGLLTLSPLLLVLTVSPAVAGQFRIFVSIIKVAYKLFPFRYEVVMRDIAAGKQNFRRLALACVVYVLGAMLVATVGHYWRYHERYIWLVPLVAVAGAVVSCLSLYPASCMADIRVLYCLVIGLIGTHTASIFFGTAGFVVGFGVTSCVIMLLGLIVIKKSLRLRGYGMHRYDV